jgi:hypothetical protein
MGMAQTTGRSMPGRRTDARIGPLRQLAGPRLLDAWERGAGSDELGRGPALLAAAAPAKARGEFAERDLPRLARDLFRLRRISFGDVLAAVVPCSACGVQVEFTVSIPPLLERLDDLDAGDAVEWTAGPARCRLRAATIADLRQAAAEPSADEARRRLIGRCFAAEGVDGVALDALRSDPDVLDRFERLHEGAEITCEVRCPGCGAAGAVDLDIARILWEEVRHAALRLLRDVHDLARAYGWPETAILTMSAERRRAYLEMVRA